MSPHKLLIRAMLWGSNLQCLMFQDGLGACLEVLVVFVSTRDKRTHVVHWPMQAYEL